MAMAKTMSEAVPMIASSTDINHAISCSARRLLISWVADVAAMSRRFVLVCCGCIVSSPLVHAEDSLCESGEEVLFSCLTSKRMASICASSNLSKSSGYIKYRYGSPGRVEFEFPKGSEHPSQVFKFESIYFAHGVVAVLDFTNGAYAYTVAHESDRAHDERAIVVARNGKQVSKLMCRDKFVGELVLDATIARFRDAGVPRPANN